MAGDGQEFRSHRIARLRWWAGRNARVGVPGTARGGAPLRARYPLAFEATYIMVGRSVYA